MSTQEKAVLAEEIQSTPEPQAAPKKVKAAAPKKVDPAITIAAPAQAAATVEPATAATVEPATAATVEPLITAHAVSGAPQINAAGLAKVFGPIMADKAIEAAKDYHEALNRTESEIALDNAVNAANAVTSQATLDNQASQVNAEFWLASLVIRLAIFLINPITQFRVVLDPAARKLASFSPFEFVRTEIGLTVDLTKHEIKAIAEKLVSTVRINPLKINDPADFVLDLLTKLIRYSSWFITGTKNYVAKSIVNNKLLAEIGLMAHLGGKFYLEVINKELFKVFVDGLRLDDLKWPYRQALTKVKRDGREPAKFQSFTYICPICGVEYTAKKVPVGKIAPDNFQCPFNCGGKVNIQNADNITVDKSKAQLISAVERILPPEN